MTKPKPTTFHGWTVVSDEAANQVLFTKPHQDAPDGMLRVSVRAGADTPHQLVRALGARNALAEDARLAPEDERDLRQARLDAAGQHARQLREALRPTPEPKVAGAVDAIIDMPAMTGAGKGRG